MSSLATWAAHNRNAGLATEPSHKFRLIIHPHIPQCRPGTPQAVAGWSEIRKGGRVSPHYYMKQQTPLVGPCFQN